MKILKRENTPSVNPTFTQERRYKMDKRIENAVVTIVGAAFITLSGWGFLALADSLYRLINL